jgi:hydrogenase maturation factor
MEEYIFQGFTDLLPALGGEAFSCKKDCGKVIAEGCETMGENAQHGGRSERLMVGKISPDLLERYVFKRAGVPDPDVLVGPRYGEDAAIIKIHGSYIAVHIDPITAAVKNIGWLAINIASNDVAVRGARPRWGIILLLLPEGAGEDLLDSITGQIDIASKRIGLSIVGGHTEVVQGLGRPIVAATIIGQPVRGIITTAGARPGDAIIMTKTAGLEGTAIIASDYRDILAGRGIDPEILDKASRNIERISVVDEALVLAERGLANSMHDPTEGGILGGVAELAYASGVGLEVWEDRIPMARETLEIARIVGIDPLRLISSGVLIATTPQERAREAIEALRSAGVEASIIGRVLEKGGGAYLIRRDGTRTKIPRYVEDEIYRVEKLLKHLLRE